MDTPTEAAGLHTCRYSDFTPSMGVPVRTSVGYPRFWSKARNGELESLPALYPDELRTMTDEAAFITAYRAKLDAREAEVLRQLVDIAARHPGQPLVLCCYEDLAKAWCHRTTAAAWLAERGFAVTELSASAGAHGTGTYDPIDDARRRKVAVIVEGIRGVYPNMPSTMFTDQTIREWAAELGVREPSEATIAMVREELAK